MTYSEKLNQMLLENNGMLHTSQVVEAGIPKSIFYNYVKENQLKQELHGVYVSEDTWVDALYLLHLRCKQAVYSHETALFFHDLTDREPSPYSITVKQGYSTSRLLADGIKVYTVKEENVSLGVIFMQTPFGHEVPVYDMERTICDLIRCRKNIETQTMRNALKQYARRKDKNLCTLMQYAEVFRVEKNYDNIWRYCYDSPVEISIFSGVRTPSNHQHSAF